MTANDTPTTQVTIGSEMLELAKGDQVRVNTSTGEVIEGTFVSLTPRGLRINSTPVGERSKYVTRKMTVVTGIELLPNGFGPAEATPAEDAPAAEPTPAATPEPLTDEDVDAQFAAITGTPVVEAPVAAAPATESNEDAPAAEYDTDPMVGGKLLSQMRFAEVMELAKQYKTPGRGVARIGALRDGVAKAIALEAGRLASAS